MQIAYVEPFQRAWQRARSLLFAPFHLQTWLAIGFAAWLAGIFEGGGSSFSSQFNGDDESFSEVGGSTLDFLQGLGVSLLVLFLFAFALVLAFAMLWVSSRMKFVFLDQVVRGDSQVKAPWNHYSARGDSLFLWRLIFTLTIFVVVGALVLLLVLTAGLASGAGLGGVSLLALIPFFTAIFFLVILPSLYISLFLDSFVVPLMYREDLSATQAWRRFLPLLRAHAGHFLLFGVVVFLLNALVTAALVMIGVMTCCVGLILIALPFVGTVVTLPVWVTFRAYSLEYLEQFGEEYRLLPPLAPSPPPSAPPPPPPTLPAA